LRTILPVNLPRTLRDFESNLCLRRSCRSSSGRLRNWRP
jgi:hypothetical protein